MSSLKKIVSDALALKVSISVRRISDAPVVPEAPAVVEVPVVPEE